MIYLSVKELFPTPPLPTTHIVSLCLLLPLDVATAAAIESLGGAGVVYFVASGRRAEGHEYAHPRSRGAQVSGNFYPGD